jgi:virulence-associated protein VagC
VNFDPWTPALRWAGNPSHPKKAGAWNPGHLLFGGLDHSFARSFLRTLNQQSCDPCSGREMTFPGELRLPGARINVLRFGQDLPALPAQHTGQTWFKLTVARIVPQFIFTEICLHGLPHRSHPLACKEEL